MNAGTIVALLLLAATLLLAPVVARHLECPHCRAERAATRARHPSARGRAPGHR